MRAVSQELSPIRKPETNRTDSAKPFLFLSRLNQRDRHRRSFVSGWNEANRKQLLGDLLADQWDSLTLWQSGGRRPFDWTTWQTVFDTFGRERRVLRDSYWHTQYAHNWMERLCLCLSPEIPGTAASCREVRECAPQGADAHWNCKWSCGLVTQINCSGDCLHMIDYQIGDGQYIES